MPISRGTRGFSYITNRFVTITNRFVTTSISLGKKSNRFVTITNDLGTTTNRFETRGIYRVLVCPNLLDIVINERFYTIYI